MQEDDATKPVSFPVCSVRTSLERKALGLLLIGGFGAIVIYPLVSVGGIESATLGYISLVAIRFVIFFCWFQIVGYWFFRYLSRSYIPYMSSCIPATTNPHVAVLIPIRDEPLSVVRRMLEHVGQITYQSFTVIVIDNSSHSQRATLVRLANELAVSIKVIRKPTVQGFKAGALNRALAMLASDVRYVLVLDVDHAPQPRILQVLVPILEAKPEVAFVQARQSYLSPERSMVGTAFNLKQRIFYEHICPGLSVAGCMFMSGSNTLIRTEALRQAGGFDESSLTEDLRTTLRFHSLGWKGIYTSEDVAIGYTPMTFAAYHRQLRRWAIGTFQNWCSSIALLAKSPSRLSMEQWLLYLGWNGLFYFQGIAAYLLLLFSLAHLFITPDRDTAFIDLVVAGCLVATAFSIALYQGRHCRAKLRTIGSSNALFYGDLAIMIKALVDLLRRNQLIFDVTPKLRGGPARPAPWFVGFHLVTSAVVAIILGYIKFFKIGSPLWSEMLWPAAFAVQSGTIGLIALATYFAEGERIDG